MFHVLQDKHRIKQRISASIPFHIERLNQLLKRIVLVFICPQRLFLQFLQVGLDRLFSARSCPDSQRVHEHPDNRIKIRMPSPRNRRSNDNIFLSTVLGQKRRICSE
ncbi:hypothetical protein D3C77_330950 [compost metagenome]